MKNRTKWITSVVILILVLALTVTAVSAAILSSSSFRIQRNTLSSAQAPGGVMSSTSYQLEGAFGGMIGRRKFFMHRVHLRRQYIHLPASDHPMSAVILSER
jgi:hypothetical protein